MRHTERDSPTHTHTNAITAALSGRIVNFLAAVREKTYVRVNCLGLWDESHQTTFAAASLDVDGCYTAAKLTANCVLNGRLWSDRR
jgi:hypothetical protein